MQQACDGGLADRLQVTGYMVLVRWSWCYPARVQWKVSTISSAPSWCRKRLCLVVVESARCTASGVRESSIFTRSRRDARGFGRRWESGNTGGVSDCWQEAG